MERGCQYCGETPAATVTYRYLISILIAYQVSHVPGHCCQTCGLAKFREACTMTLVGGWWGFPGFFGIPIILLMNNAERLSIPVGRPPSATGLAGIVVSAQGEATIVHPRVANDKTLDPGKPLLRRWSSYTIVILLAVLVLVLWMIRA